MARISRNVVLVTVLALALTACGRKSDLERPHAADAPKDANGHPISKLDRPFVLDPLLK